MRNCNRPASFGGTLGNDMFVHCICNTPFGTRIKSNQTNKQKQNFLSFSKWLAVVRDTTITMVSLLQLPRCTGWYQHWWLQWLQFYHRFIFDLRSTMWMHQVLPWNNMFDAVQEKSHAKSAASVCNILCVHLSPVQSRCSALLYINDILAFCIGYDSSYQLLFTRQPELKIRISNPIIDYALSQVIINSFNVFVLETRHQVYWDVNNGAENLFQWCNRST